MINADEYFTLTASDEVGVVINNLGGTSNLELAVMANDTIRYLGAITHHYHLYSCYIVVQWMLGRSTLSGHTWVV